MKTLWPIVIAALLCGCGEHSQPREAPLSSDRAEEEAVNLEELDSVSRAAVMMMQDYFRVIDSSMKEEEPEAVRSVPVFDLQDVDGAQSNEGSTTTPH